MKPLTIIFLLFFVQVSFAHDLVWPGEKLKALFPLAESFEQKNLYVSDEQRAALEKTLGYRLPEEDLKPSIYLAIVRDTQSSTSRKAAAMMFIDAHGEGGKIEMGVVVGGKGEIMKIYIFENKESEKLLQPQFLKQFENKKSSDLFKVGADISAPAGGEKSAQAIASGARRGLLIINEMFRKK
ncbi:MAG: hypothetical protein C4550_03790 [Nitrospiraceae bacterium]|nr:MAG: hypothetical protein C4550_03790 [Nitrospiraceae bacterium]